MRPEKYQNVQDAFLNQVRKSKTTVTIFLMSGVQLHGIIVGFDNFSFLLKRDSRIQLVYKHAISTVMPQIPILLHEQTEGEEKEKSGAEKSQDPPVTTA